MELPAVSNQQSANTLFLIPFAESRKLARRTYGGLMADSAPVLRSPSSAVACYGGWVVCYGGWKAKNVSFWMSTK